MKKPSVAAIQKKTQESDSSDSDSDSESDEVSDHTICVALLCKIPSARVAHSYCFPSPDIMT